ncbi:RING finger protein 37 [Protopterus annectens]|uniref:RING finger protein 37 n=1 Tax=Protopterus annectens TaxID=7888 RepID=UPI001CFBB7BE|nr:RING finger protein 37 [Protopterus annectens]XP_043920034.1 RING finger protein 37 [Protopterus annectens]XP_043920036.1 RING finger protein 37 [Protopterus annectens]
MVINLCLPQFRPRIHCNKICADGYEVENLISSDPVKRHRGFHAEYFIKPPINITLSFPFNIEICQVNIRLSTGGHQTCTGLDIRTCTSSTRATWNVLQDSQDFQGQAFSDKDVFILVGKTSVKEHTEVTFKNKVFVSRFPFDKVSVDLSTGSLLQELWSKGPNALTNVSHLKLCITHATGGYLPYIKNVEVWGQPAKSCPRQALDSVLKAHLGSVPQKPSLQLNVFSLSAEGDLVSSVHSAEPLPTSAKMMETFDTVPEEFLDPITLEIMTLPMLLPSGKVIDQSTLEKYNKSEATWGRVPNDPFTGVAYNQHSKPVPHPPLKARIDHFLLQNRSRMPGITILGGSHTSGTATPSTLMAYAVKRRSDCLDDGASFDFSRISDPSRAGLESAAKRLKTETTVSLPHSDYCTGSVSHEQRLTDSLDCALTSVLDSLPSFTASVSKGLQCSSSSSTSWAADTMPEYNTGSLVQGCASCFKTFSVYFKTEPVYQLPCGHLLCRTCLTEKQKTSSLMCMKCKRIVATHDVQRIHF